MTTMADTIMDTGTSVPGAAEMPTRNRQTLIIRVATLLVALCVLFLRVPQTFTGPQFWGEDGTFFFSAQEDGWPSLLLPIVGYFCSLQRLVALIAGLFPPTLGPA